MSTRLRRPRYADVVGTLALVLALGTGGAYAATHLPKNSVTTKQVKNGSLVAKDFKQGQLPAGAQGPKGDPGKPGPNLLATGSFTKAAPDNLALACQADFVTGPAFTLTSASQLYVAGSFNYSSTAGVNSAKGKLQLLPGASGATTPVANSPAVESGISGNRSPGATTAGLLTASGATFLVQPGTYRLNLDVEPNGTCTGTAVVSDVAFSWLALPPT